MTQPKQQGNAFGVPRGSMLAGVAALLIASWALPASANDEPLTRSKPAVTAPAKPAAARTAPRVAAERRAARRVVQQPVRVAAMQRRDADCILFFCWGRFPLLLGVGY